MIGFFWAGLAVFFDSEKKVKVGSKSWILTCSCHITLSLPFYTDPASKRELNFSNGYLSLLYFWALVFKCHIDDKSLMGEAIETGRRTKF